MSKDKKIKDFDPSGVGNVSDGLFGLPFNFEESEIIILPVPWEVTASFGSGSSEAPEKILKASAQVDLLDPENPDGWKRGYFMLDVSSELRSKNKKYMVKAREIIKMLEHGADIESSPDLIESRSKINDECKEMVNWTYTQTKTLLNRGKKVGLIGGDHSTPLGYYKALSEFHTSFAMLQIDAHADLRHRYEGFDYSHASIMHNAIELDHISKVLQLGIRDFCEEEKEYIKRSDGKVEMMHWNETSSRLFRGESWDSVCSDILDRLPSKVYISVDVDGLSPEFCPNTGTPVPGGLSFDQLMYLLSKIYQSDKEILGFDICETGNDGWDANVSARILYKLCNFI